MPHVREQCQHVPPELGIERWSEEMNTLSVRHEDLAADAAQDGTGELVRHRSVDGTDNDFEKSVIIRPPMHSARSDVLKASGIRQVSLRMVSDRKFGESDWLILCPRRDASQTQSSRVEICLELYSSSTSRWTFVLNGMSMQDNNAVTDESGAISIDM